MARSYQNDPVEKFRFLVTIFEPSKAFIATNGSGNATPGTAPTPLSINTSLVNNGQNPSRSGFQEVILPEATTTTIRYRENIDGFSYRKFAGLTNYSLITLRRGVMPDTQLFTFFTDTNNEASALNIFNTALASDFGAISFQNSRYRKDLLISSLDRTGVFVKHWYISNAFVVGYKGGNDLNAQISEKLIEELIFDYEFFIEVLGSDINDALNNVSTLAAQAAEQEAITKAAGVGIGTAGGLIGSLF